MIEMIDGGMNDEIPDTCYVDFSVGGGDHEFRAIFDIGVMGNAIFSHTIEGVNPDLATVRQLEYLAEVAIGYREGVTA